MIALGTSYRLLMATDPKGAPAAIIGGIQPPEFSAVPVGVKQDDLPKSIVMHSHILPQAYNWLYGRENRAGVVLGRLVGGHSSQQNRQRRRSGGRSALPFHPDELQGIKA